MNNTPVLFGTPPQKISIAGYLNISISEAWKEDIGDADVLLIPTILDLQNAANYDGVDFALRCYFHFLQQGNAFSIILLGAEDKASFFSHCELSHFLKCPNVHYAPYSLKDIEDIRAKEKYLPKSFDKKDCIDKLKAVGVKPPSSYQSHHSITNEWSCYRWSRYLGIASCDAKEKDDEINKSLYYNYLRSIFPTIDIIYEEGHLLRKNGRLLLIDDEEAKGWSNLFKSAKFKSSELIFGSIGGDFKRLTSAQILDSAIEKVKSFNPDVVILDLRLHDDDYRENLSADQLTGIRILQKIKEENEGIQVIAFTASNKVWNYQKLQEYGINGFVLKESPELSQDENFTKNSLENLRSTLIDALNKSYLKKIFLQITAIKELKSGIENFDTESDRLLETAWVLLQQGHLSYAFLTLYQILENFAAHKYDSSTNQVNCIEMIKEIEVNKFEYMITYNSDEKCYVKKPNIQSTKNNFSTQSNFKLACIFAYGLDKDDDFLKAFSKINKRRNEIAHQGKKINESYLTGLLDIISEVKTPQNSEIAVADAPIVPSVSDAQQKKS